MIGAAASSPAYAYFGASYSKLGETPRRGIGASAAKP